MQLPTDTLGFYKIVYPNGVTQAKYLIDQDVFDEWYNRIKTIDKWDEDQSLKYESLKKEANERFGVAPFYFTTESPIMLNKDNVITLIDEL